MPKVNISQYQFWVRDPYQVGQIMGPTEANVLNYHRADLIRKAMLRTVTSAEANCPDGVLTISELEKLISIIALFDSQYALSPREEPKMPAFDYQLYLIAMDEIGRMGPQHLIPDMEQLLATGMRDPSNRQKARRQLVSNIRSIELPAED